MFGYIEMVMTSQHINKTLNPTSWHSATSPPSLMVRLFFWRYVCSYLAISIAQSIIRDRLLFVLPFILKGLQRITPYFFEGLQNILKGMWRPRPQNKGNSPSILFPRIGCSLYSHLSESFWKVRLHLQTVGFSNCWTKHPKQRFLCPRGTLK